MEEEKRQDGKFKTSISVDWYYVDRMDELIKAKKFVSRSGIVEVSLAEFFGHMDERESLKKQKVDKPDSESFFELLIESYLQTEAGKKLIQSKLSTTEDENILFSDSTNKNRKFRLQ